MDIYVGDEYIEPGRWGGVNSLVKDGGRMEKAEGRDRE